MTDVAMDDFDALVKEYPDNYTVRYERMYALYMLGRYSEVAESSKKLLKSPDATPLTFQLCGNASTISDRPTRPAKSTATV